MNASATDAPAPTETNLLASTEGVNDERFKTGWEVRRRSGRDPQRNLSGLFVQNRPRYGRTVTIYSYSGGIQLNDVGSVKEVSFFGPT